MSREYKHKARRNQPDPLKVIAGLELALDEGKRAKTSKGEVYNPYSMIHEPAQYWAWDLGWSQG